jgi:hypothetical protein
VIGCGHVVIVVDFVILLKSETMPKLYLNVNMCYAETMPKCRNSFGRFGSVIGCGHVVIVVDFVILLKSETMPKLYLNVNMRYAETMPKCRNSFGISAVSAVSAFRHF